jgi:hypothetical protein
VPCCCRCTGYRQLLLLLLLLLHVLSAPCRLNYENMPQPLWEQ